MAFADTQKLLVELNLGGNFVKNIAAAQRSLGGFDARLSKTESRAFRVGQQIGTGIKNGVKIAAVGLAALGTQVVAGLGQLSQLEELTAQTNAVIKSTGGVAGISAEQVRHLAEQYENLNATIDDKVIQSGENLLLTFRDVGKEAFQPALQAALDMSTALKQDLNTSVLQLGKALSDPVAGLTALRRAGVIFSKDQIKLIKHLVKTGDLLGAQKVILAEVGKEFGGSFAAQGKTAAGAIAGIGDAVEDLQKALATALFPTIQKVLPKIREFLTSPAFTKGAEDLGKAIAGVFSDENIAAAGEIIKSVFETARAAAPVVAAAAKTMAGIVSTAVNVFKSLPPEIQQLAIGAFAINKLTGGLVTNLASGLISSVLKQLVSGVVNVNGTVVNVNGAVGGGGGNAPGGGSAPGGFGLGSAVALGSGALIIGGVEAAGHDFTESVLNNLTGDPRLAEAGASISTAAASGIQPIFGPINRLLTFLQTGDPNGGVLGGTAPSKNTGLRPPGGFNDGEAAKLLNVSNERLESIKTNTDAQNAKADALNASVTHVTAQDAINAALTRAKIGEEGTSERATIERAKTAQTAAIAKAGQDTRSETAAVKRAIDAKKLSVTTNVNVATKVSVQDVIKSTTKYKSVYNVAQ